MDIDLNCYSPLTITRGAETISAYTKHVLCEDGALIKAPDIAQLILPKGRVAVMFEEHSQELALVLADLMRSKDYFVDVIDNKELREDVRLIVAVGAGDTANRAKLLASANDIPWMWCISAPSTDSGLYSYAERFEGSKRLLVPCSPPVAVIADDSVMRGAPDSFIAAGYGCAVSKLLVLFNLQAKAIIDKCEEPLAAYIQAALSPLFGESATVNPITIAAALIKLGIIEQCAPAPDYTCREEYTVALALSAYTNSSRLIGENLMLSTIAIALIYDCYFRHAPQDLFVPVNYIDDYRALDRACHIDMFELLISHRSDTQIARRSFVLREYREDLLAALTSTVGDIKSKAVKFRRLYSDAGYWLGNYITPSKLIALTRRAAALLNDNSPLSTLKNSGFLDSALAQEFGDIV